MYKAMLGTMWRWVENLPGGKDVGGSPLHSRPRVPRIHFMEKSEVESTGSLFLVEGLIEPMSVWHNTFRRRVRVSLVCARVRVVKLGSALSVSTPLHKLTSAN